MPRFRDVFGIKRILLLSAAGLVAIAVPFVFGQVNATHSPVQSQAQNTAATTPMYEYEVASIKPFKSGGDMPMGGVQISPNRLSAAGVTLYFLIQAAFDVKNNNQIYGEPSWAKSEQYDIEAKADKSVADEMQKLSINQRTLEQCHMIQALLEDRFQLKFHLETKELPVYWLVVAKVGKLHESEGDCGPTPKLPPSKPEPGKARTPPCGGLNAFLWGSRFHIGGQNISVTQLVDALSGPAVGRTILDKTGLAGKYDINLDWTPEEGQFLAPQGGVPNGLPPPPEANTNGPSLFAAIQEQLGLKLKSGKGPVEIIIIDHVEKPSEN